LGGASARRHHARHPFLLVRSLGRRARPSGGCFEGVTPWLTKRCISSIRAEAAAA
jgi:hypothetical protein